MFGKNEAFEFGTNLRLCVHSPPSGGTEGVHGVIELSLNIKQSSTARRNRD